VIFNYDRCVEHFFRHALQRFYNVTAKDAASIVGKAKIFHPYGLAGELGDADGAGASAPFGGDRADCYALGRTMLKTYTERVDSKEIKNAVRASEQIVLLGFAYHEQNMRLLAEVNSLDLKQIIGTAYGVSENDLNVIRRQLAAWSEKNIKAKRCKKSTSAMI
jgi:hypothetical protein